MYIKQKAKVFYILRLLSFAFPQNLYLNPKNAWNP